MSVAPAPVPTVKLFLSWYSGDRELKEDLVNRLRVRLRIEKGINFEWWDDSELSLGENWKAQLRKHVAEADYVLQFLSPGFLASEIIEEIELQKEDGSELKFLPVQLVYVDPQDKNIDWKGLDELQQFFSSGRSYEQTPSQERNAFVDALVRKIRARVLTTDGTTNWSKA